MKIHQLYRKLRGKYAETNELWKEWCKSEKTKADKERIMVGAMLTQRTNWRNVEKAFDNLKKAEAISLEEIYRLGKRDIKSLEKLIRPSGFYRQKARRLHGLCEFIIKERGGLEKFLKQDLDVCRAQLLELSGIGPETADSILLYAGQKPVFVIDEYTRRLAKKYRISRKFSYDHLQNLFQKNLPKNIKLYQDFHAMIVLEGKNIP